MTDNTAAQGASDSRSETAKRSESKPLPVVPSKHMAYMVEAIKQSVSINLFPEKELDFSSLAEGCIGVSLWFDKYSDAEKYAGGRKISQAEVNDLRLDNPESKVRV